MKTENQHINIRPAGEKDMEDVCRIYNQAVALRYVTADNEPVTVASRLEFWKTVTKVQDRPFWILEYDGKIAAFFYFRNYYDRPAYRITAEIGMYIDNEFQGKGLGKCILEYCCSQTQNCGIENLLALIFAANKRSISLFEKFGFELKGEYKNIAKTSEGYNDLLVFQKNFSS